MRALYAVSWTEYERGWGHRPDGITVYDSEKRGKEHIEKVHGDRSGPVPDDYINADGPPKLIEVSESLYKYTMSKGVVWLNFNRSELAKTYQAPEVVIEWPLPAN